MNVIAVAATYVQLLCRLGVIVYGAVSGFRKETRHWVWIYPVHDVLRLWILSVWYCRGALLSVVF